MSECEHGTWDCIGKGDKHACVVPTLDRQAFATDQEYWKKRALAAEKIRYEENQWQAKRDRIGQEQLDAAHSKIRDLAAHIRRLEDEFGVSTGEASGAV